MGLINNLFKKKATSPTLTEKEVSVIYKTTKEHDGKAYGSRVIEELSGGVIYKQYFEMLSPKKFSKDIAYIKLVLANKEEIIVSPLTLLEKALKESNEVWMGRFEFKNKKLKIRYLYLSKVGKYYFDLPESMANELQRKIGLKLEIID